MGEHQLTIRDYLRHSNLQVTNKYLQATAETKRLAQDKLVGAILPAGLLSGGQVKGDPIAPSGRHIATIAPLRFVEMLIGPKRTQIGFWVLHK